MGTGYVRQSAANIVDGLEVLAAPLNAEYNALKNAFDGNGGHAHDGLTGNGPKIDLTTSIVGILPIANGGAAAVHKLNATVAPVVGNDNTQGYGVGSDWIDVTADKYYKCVDATTGAAVWIELPKASAVQPLDALLTAIAALTTANNKGVYFTAVDTVALYDLTVAGRALLDDADASAQLTTLGVSTFAKTFLDDADAATVLATIGAQPVDATLTAVAGVTTATDKAIYFTNVDVAASYTLTAFARTLLDDVDASTARATLGVRIGTDVQTQNANLDALAGLTMAADKVAYFTSSSAATTMTVTSFARTLLDDADAATMRTTLGVTPTGTAGALDIGTTAQYVANTPNKALVSDQVWAAMVAVTLTDAATIALDMATFINATVTLAGNRTLGAPSNTKEGQSGFIKIVQDGTGSRTLAYNSAFKFPGGTVPSLSTVSGSIDVLYYTVMNSSYITAALAKGFA